MSTLEERLDRMERRLLELQAKEEIAGLMGRYAFYYSAECGSRIMEELWSSSDEISLEFGASGVFRNRWQIRSFYINEAIPGRMNTLTLSTPVIRVSDDGTAARGCWMAFATETDPGDFGPEPATPESNRRSVFSACAEDGRQYRAEVLLQRYEADFRREADSWRILHLHVIEYFRCPWNRDWVQFAEERFHTDGVWLEQQFITPEPLPEDSHGENLPDTASTYHWQYTCSSMPGKAPDFEQKS